MINIIFATIFAVGFMALSFVLGALWCLKWYRDEEDPECKEKFFEEALKKKPSRKESCAMYDESCENNNCNLCIIYEEKKND